MKSCWKRRDFIASGLAGAAGSIALGNNWASAGKRTKKLPIRTICVFSKHLQWLDWKEMAITARRIGFDGIDLTLRPGGHVEPDNVEQALPEAIRTIRGEGLLVPMVTSAITDPELSLTRRILETAAGQGVRYYRMGYYRYSDSEAIPSTLESIRRKTEKLARLNESIGIQGSYQNHAGNGYFGSSLWDLWLVLRDLSPQWIGSQFDLRHAVTESSLSWRTGLRILQHHLHSLAVKDSRWVSSEDHETWTEHCELGHGYADFTDIGDYLNSPVFSGMASMHFEYPLGGAEHGSRNLDLSPEVVKAAMRRDLSYLRSLAG